MMVLFSSDQHIQNVKERRAYITVSYEIQKNAVIFRALKFVDCNSD